MSADAVEIVNEALVKLGAATINSLTNDALNNDPTISRVARGLYLPTLLKTLRAHPWNFAIRRIVLATMSTPNTNISAGATSPQANVLFQTTLNFFTAAMIGQEIVATSSRARIGTLVSATGARATITSTFFTTAAIASGAWNLTNQPPAFGYLYTIKLPDGTFFDGSLSCLRVLRLEQDPEFKVEGRAIVTDEATVQVRYIGAATDPETWDSSFREAMTAHLAWKMAIPITNKSELAEGYAKAYQAALRDARTDDGMEGSPEVLLSDDLTDVRLGGL